MPFGTAIWRELIWIVYCRATKCLENVSLPQGWERYFKYFSNTFYQTVFFVKIFYRLSHNGCKHGYLPSQPKCFNYTKSARTLFKVNKQCHYTRSTLLNQQKKQHWTVPVQPGGCVQRFFYGGQCLRESGFVESKISAWELYGGSYYQTTKHQRRNRESRLSLDSDTRFLKDKASSALCAFIKKNTCSIRKVGIKYHSAQYVHSHRDILPNSIIPL